MTRPQQAFLEEAAYHAHNRLARGERVFADDRVARRFRDLLGEVSARDRLTVLVKSRSRSRELVRARELLAVIGGERCGVRLSDVAREIDRWPDGVTETIARTVRILHDSFSCLGMLDGPSTSPARPSGATGFEA